MRVACDNMSSPTLLCRHMWAMFLVFISLLSLANSFNLEPRIPLVKVGSPQSHFGYSVAQHKSIRRGVGSRVNHVPWILVGAPKDHNLQPGTVRSGALWKCPLTTNSTDCIQVETDGYKDPDSGLYRFEYKNGQLSPPDDDEIKDDQWLGVTLKSQGDGGDVLVCAHRYTSKVKDSQYGFGLCYILDQNLEVMNSLEPCRGKPIKNGHLQFGVCQAGTSGLILEDEVVLGVPGPYTWKGTVHTSNISKDFLFRDKTQYFGPVTGDESPVDKYSYLGYSVTAGRFLGDFISYVGGAPRSDGTGQVVFFSRNKIGESTLLVDLILNGEMFASSFGFEVLAVDINNDNFDDLIVGAPFYYTAHSSGAIYIYMNDRNGIKETTKFTKIEGPPGESRFGFSMTKLGDLNLDGYQDIAIGAPYEESGGAIYIYLGSEKGLVTEPSQVIRGSDMPPGTTYNAFGYALSGGLDMDGNGYPDLVASSFCSDKVLLIRSRPVINIETLVLPEGGPKNIDPSKRGCPDDPDSQETCFGFDACFMMKTLDENTRTGLLLQYTIEERVYKDQPISRIHFSKDSLDESTIVSRKVDLRPEDIGKHLCNREIAYLKSGSRDLLRPVRFKLNYEIFQREPQMPREGDPIPNVDDYPILDQQEAVKYFQGEFVKDCGSDDICESDLKTEAVLRLPWDNARHHQVFELGKRNHATLETSVTNLGEPAYEPNLYIEHHESMAYSHNLSDTGNYLCAASSSANNLIHCSLGNPLTNGTGHLHFAFKPAGFFEKSFIEFIIYANSTSVDVSPQEPVRILLEIVERAEISITGTYEPEQVFYSGDVVGESGVDKIENIGSEVIHNYKVTNDGPWRVDYMDVNILWPYQVENYQPEGKWLLYLTGVPEVAGDGECVVDPDHINPLALASVHGPDHTYFGGAKGEATVTRAPPTPPTKNVDDYGDPDYVVTGGGSSTTVYKNKTTSISKITSSSTSNTIRKETSKSSSKENVVSGGTSSSSTSSSSSSSSSIGGSSDRFSPDFDYDEEYDYSDYEEYPEEKEEDRKYINSNRNTGTRTHSRVSRRVFSSSSSSGHEGSGSGRGESYSHGSSSKSRGSVTTHSSGGGPISEFENKNSDSGSGWRSRTYAGGRGREDRREFSNTFIDKDGARVSESQNEVRRTYVDGTDDDGSSRRKSSFSRTEHSNRVSSSSSGDGRYGGDTVHSSSRGRDGYSIDNSIDGGNRREYDSSRGFTRNGDGGTSSRDQYGYDNRNYYPGSGSGQSSSSRFETSRRYSSSTSNRDGHEDPSRSETSRSSSWSSRSTSGDPTRTYSSSGDRYGDASRSESSRSHYSSNRNVNDHPISDQQKALKNYQGDCGSDNVCESDLKTEAELRLPWDDSRRHRIFELGKRITAQLEISVTNLGEPAYEPNLYIEHHESMVFNHTYSDTGNYICAESSSANNLIHCSLGNPLTKGTGLLYFAFKPADFIEFGFIEFTIYANSTSVDVSPQQPIKILLEIMGSMYYTPNRNKNNNPSRPKNSQSYQSSQSESYPDSSRSETSRSFSSNSSPDSSRTETHRSYSSSNSGNAQDSSRWGSGGFKSSENADRTHYNRQWSNRRHNDDHNRQWSNRRHNDDQENELVDSQRHQYRSRNYHDGGNTYSKAIIDDRTGEAKVYSKHVYEDDRHHFNSGNRDDELQTSLHRVKRQVVVQSEAYTDDRTGRTLQAVNLRCTGDNPTAKCIPIKCNIRNLRALSSVKIKVKSRLWSSTLVEDYSHVNLVNIQSRGEIILPEDIRSRQNETDDVAYIETKAYANLLEQPKSVPIWAIILAVLAGLLVLLLIILLLWKCGFFKRKRPGS